MDFTSLLPHLLVSKSYPVLLVPCAQNPVLAYPLSETVLSQNNFSSLLAASILCLFELRGYINTTLGVPDKLKSILYFYLLNLSALHHTHLSKHISDHVMFLFKLPPLSITEFVFWFLWVLFEFPIHY